MCFNKLYCTYSNSSDRILDEIQCTNINDIDSVNNSFNDPNTIDVLHAVKVVCCAPDSFLALSHYFPHKLHLLSLYSLQYVHIEQVIFERMFLSQNDCKYIRDEMWKV